MRDDALSVIVSGSSAAMATSGYLSWLRQEIDLPLRVLLTASAERFVPPQVAAWYADEVWTSADPGLNPTEFAKRSVGLVVLPATANMLAATALGLAGTPAQTALLASDRPSLFFPSMNRSMWVKRVTQRHVEALRDEGHTVVEPQDRVIFELWQRENAIGIAMPPPDTVAELIASWLETTLAAEGEEATGTEQTADPLA
ncbi:flavoprotein [Micromonospora sp. NPDC051141]|uniref:flavoprotein n=1 Tax=Micromonospora sp. NPDC051141 TaxID=3364284 RepID=UPI0037A065BD